MRDAHGLDRTRATAFSCDHPIPAITSSFIVLFGPSATMAVAQAHATPPLSGVEWPDVSHRVGADGVRRDDLLLVDYQTGSATGCSKYQYIA